jgi:hypothetical protein
VVFGHEYTVAAAKKADWISVPFEVAEGLFLVCLELRNQD